jgi:hypothetical protein
MRKNLTKEEFVTKAKQIHGDLYDYSLFNYIKRHSIGKIICQNHGVFDQLANNHLKGHGCPFCSTERNSNLKRFDLYSFIKKAKILHKEKYDYSLFVYFNAHTKGKIGCVVHGVFEQTPSNHLYGKGCPKCTSQISKPETAWLDTLNIDLRNHKITLNNGRIRNVDGYNKETNTVYQFHGDYWHGNPNTFNLNDINKRAKKTFQELFDNTIKNDKMIVDSGFNLIVKWEDGRNRK